MNDTINDIEEALGTWDLVADANGLVWIRDENECLRFWMVGNSCGRPEGSLRPVPPFTNARERRAYNPLTPTTEHP